MKANTIKLIITLLGVASFAYGQNTLTVMVRDKEDKELLAGAVAVLEHTSRTAVSDKDGILILTGIPDGEHEISFSYVGYKSDTRTYRFPETASDTLRVYLVPDAEELEEVIVQATRGTRTIQNIPTRIEFMSAEELDEKASMSPGDIRMLLSESTGISTGQTSAASGNATIRIQGLEGRYTQILKDGFPAFSDAASGLGLLQTPPLDLKQVEVIKGSASTLYGGGAIAGLINLVSKVPEEKLELSLLLNGTTGNGLDTGVFWGQRGGKVGGTFLAAYNRNWGYAPGGTAFTAIPAFDRYTLNPKLFLYLSPHTELNLALETMFENRLGGDILYVKGRGDGVHSYYERNKTRRHAVRLAVDHRWNEQNRLAFKSSVTYDDRKMSEPAFRFEGSQLSSFHELSLVQTRSRSEWVGGINLWTERFKERRLSAFPLRNYNQATLGAFVQNDWKVAEWFDWEAGLRADYVSGYGYALLPRVSAHFKVTDRLSSRLGGGFGYKVPTIFTEDTERLQYKGVLPVDKKHSKLERSYGLNWDVNYVTSLCDDRVSLSINQLFFYTYLRSPLFLRELNGGLYQLEQSGHMATRGGETNVKIGYEDLHLYVGYTFTDAGTHEARGGCHENTLVPKHRINAVLMYEVEDKWRIGLESYYFSSQKLNDSSRGKAYTICGFMIEKIWENFSLFANFENFTDRRQTRFDTINTGSITHPVFRDIYAPLDGFVMNGGVKLRF